MNNPLRGVLKHSAIYGVGQILTRLASILLLPIYTHCLRPADYGALAILDLTGGVLGVLIGSGIGSAAGRFHFDVKTEKERDAVWWTALGIVFTTSTVLVAPVFLFRDVLANALLGPEVSGGSLFFALMLGAMWSSAVGQVADVYLRVRKWSAAVVAVSLGGLLLNIGLNLSFLLILKWGVAGVLAGNFIATALAAGLRVGCIVCSRPLRFDLKLAPQMGRFGGPLVVTALMALLMHQMDRYLLRLFVDLDQIGVYSLAYAVGQGVNSLVLTPFAAIWMVIVCEIAGRPEAASIYVKGYEYFVYALLMVLFGVCLFIKPLLTLLTSEMYWPAAELAPIVCLGYFFFSLHTHFQTPAIVAKRSASLIPVFVVATIVNGIANLVLLPLWGAVGAAWATVVTYIVFSFGGLFIYRRIDRYPYPITRTMAVVAGVIAAYMGLRVVESYLPNQGMYLCAAGLVWLAWTLALLGPALRQWLMGRVHVRPALTSTVEVNH